MNNKNTLNINNSVTKIFQLGQAILAFLEKRIMYLTLEQLMATIELVFPLKASTLTNQELIDEFIRDGEYRIKKITADQYRTHLNGLNASVNKRFIFVTPEDCAKHIRSKSIKKRKHGPDKVVQSVHDHIINVDHNFFEWMIRRGYYCRLLTNPVQVKCLGNKRRVPKKSCIWTAQEYQRLIDALPWHVYPVAVAVFELGVRPLTAPRVSHSDYEYDIDSLELTAAINKIGQAHPALTDEIKAKLAPWLNCTGPLVWGDALKIMRDTARRLGIRKKFSDDARKTAISMRAAILRKKDAANAEARLTRQFGNSDDIRKIFYDRPQPYKEAVAFFAVKRTFSPIVISPKEARNYRRSQIKAAGRVAIAISESAYEHTYTSPKQKIAGLRRAAERKAWMELSPLHLFPTFVSVSGDWGISDYQRAKLSAEAAIDEKVALLYSMNEQLAHEEDQMSLFHGRGDLFLEEGSISAECPQIPTDNSSPKKP